MKNLLKYAIWGIILSIGFLSCEQATDVHNHTFATDWTSDESYHWHAATCGHNELESDRAPHTFGEWTVVKAATKDADGLKERICVICNYKETEEIANLSHIHTYSTAWSSDANNHWHAATCKHTSEVSDRASHTYGDWTVVTEATNDTDGLKERNCIVCNYKETKEIASLSHTHTYSTAWSSDVNNHWHAATCKHTSEVSDRASHTYGEWTVIKSATEESDGLKERICVICNYKETKEIASLSHTHTYSTAWSSDTNAHWHAATCKHTSEVNDRALHIYGNWTVVKAATEDIDGLKERVCVVCNYKETEAIANLAHTHTYSTIWTSDENAHWHAATCKHTSEVSDKTSHTYGEWTVIKSATEESDGLKERFCSTCNHKETKEIASLSHTHTYSTAWSSDTNAHWHAATCKHTSEVSDKYMHNWNDGKVIIPPTETEEGLKTYTCVTCQKTKNEILEKLPHSHTFSSEWTNDDSYHWHAATCDHKEETSGKTVHTWNNGNITKLPSATELGIKTFTCTVCGKTKTEDISKIAVPKISISYVGETDISVDSTTTETGIVLTATSGYDTYEWSSLGTILSKTSELNLLSKDYPLGIYVFDLLAKKNGKYYSASVNVTFGTKLN